MGTFIHPSMIKIYGGARLVRCPECGRKKRYDAIEIEPGWLFIEDRIECPNLECCAWYNPLTERQVFVPNRPRYAISSELVLEMRNYDYHVARFPPMSWSLVT